MLQTLKNCPLCGSTSIKSSIAYPAWRIKTHESFQVNTCGNCGVGYTSPRPDENNIGKYYSFENYDSHNSDKKGLFALLYKVSQQLMFKYKYAVLKSYLGENVLDYGAGNGAWVHFLMRNSYNATGLELSDYARSQAESSFKIKLNHPRDLEKISDESLSCITGFHVFEHLYNPNEMADIFYQKLNKGAYLCIAVPNNNSYDAKHYGVQWAAKDVPIHTLHFHDTSIKKFLEAKGFNLVSKKGLILDSFYVSLLSEQIKKGNPFKGSLIGFVSFLNGLFFGNWSSKIYIFQKP